MENLSRVPGDACRSARRRFALKLFLWIWTLIGLLPILLFSVLHIYSSWQIRRELQLQPSRELAENEFVISTSTVQFDGFKDPMVISTSIWPGLFCLMGISITVAGLFFLIPRQPIRLRTAVYERIPAIVDQVLVSKKPYASLIISSRDGNYAILLSKRDDRVEISLSGSHSDLTELTAVREYFHGLGVAPSQDYTTHDDTFDITTTHLAYDLTDVATGPSEVCTHILRNIYSIGPDELFQFDLDT
jgi:hypothetical protein